MADVTNYMPKLISGMDKGQAEEVLLMTVNLEAAIGCLIKAADTVNKPQACQENK